MADRLTQIGEMAHGTVRQEDVGWLIGEIERLRLRQRRPLRNLKLVLMELGNRLVTEHGWEPAGRAWERVPAGDHTGLIAGLTQQLNDSQEMREVLDALGFDWPIADEDEIGFYWPVVEEDE